MRLFSNRPGRWRAMALAGVALLVAGGATLPADPAQAAVPCQVDYQSQPWRESSTGGGFIAWLTITNLSAPIAGWSLGFTLPAGQTVRNGWSAVWPPAGTAGPITVTNLAFNSHLGTGHAIQIGFTGGWSGTHTNPTTFTLNGLRCNQDQPPDPPDPRVANPYQGARVYVNPDWAEQVAAQATATGGALGEQMAQLASNPTAVWIDDIDAIAGLAGHLDEALAQQQAGGGTPAVIQLVLYNVPGRDCAGRGAPGELTFEPADQVRYRTGFIEPIAEILARPQYAGLRIAVIVEPGALSSLLFDITQGFLECETARQQGIYRDAVRYALGQLAALPNVYSYLEVPGSGLGGYDSNFNAFVDLYTQTVAGPGGPGVASVAGFATNVTGYAPNTEPFLPDPNLAVSGLPIWQSRFLDFNRHYQELPYAQTVRTAFLARGFPSGIGMLIDTSRNGWGGQDRPVRISLSGDVNIHVDESRIDRRPNRAAWCNQVSAGLGERPRAAPAAGIHAFTWVKPPGESDGVADSTAAPDPDRPYLRHRNPCDPLWSPPQGSHIPSNALPGAPHFGRWFPAMFDQLVRNAHPPT